MEAGTPTAKPSHGKSSANRRLKRRSADSTHTPRGVVDKGNRQEDMAASFLQYCAMCEKLITTPCNSILYCSAACRRKDAAKPLSASTFHLESNTQVSPPASPRVTLSPRSSIIPVYQEHPSSRIPSDDHNHKSDLDPSEWKPRTQRGVLASSEAYRYLTRFHQAQAGAGNLNPEQGEYIKLDRPAFFHHKSTLSMTALSPGTTTPSLANTPTTAASSMDSLYEFNLRPLGPRKNPLYSSSACHGHGFDLVTPHVPPPVLAVMDSDDAESVLDLWGKKVVVPSSTPKGEGLGALLGRAKQRS